MASVTTGQPPRLGPHRCATIDGCGRALVPKLTHAPHAQQELYRQYRHVRFRCGEDDDGYSVKMKLKYFLRYMAQQKDDSPLYIFDNHFDGNAKAQTILKQYSIPKYFRDDLFRLVGEKNRPPYRWYAHVCARRVFRS